MKSFTVMKINLGGHFNGFFKKMNRVIRDDILNILKRVNLGKLSRKKILITGSNGLIGTYLISTLYLANQELGLDIQVIGLSKHRPNSTLREFQNDSRFSFYPINLVNSELNYDVDYIVHGATYAQPKKFLKNKLETIKLNTEVTEKLLKLCRKKNGIFLFLSSSEIYGDPSKEYFPTPETFPGNCSTTSTRAAYAESKRLGETLCGIFQEDYHLDIHIARISAVYGPGVSIYDQRVLGHFLRKALLKKHIDLLDKGEQIRTWCYIADCIVMLLSILLHGQSFIYNVGGKDTVSIIQLAEIISELTQSTYSLPLQTEQVDFLKQASNWVEVDIQKISNEFKLGEFTNLRKGLQNTIQWNQDVILPELKK